VYDVCLSLKQPRDQEAVGDAAAAADDDDMSELTVKKSHNVVILLYSAKLHYIASVYYDGKEIE